MMSAVKEDLDPGDISNTDITDRKTLTKKVGQRKKRKKTRTVCSEEKKKPIQRE